MISETDKVNFQVRSFGGLSFSRGGQVYFPALGRIITELFAYLCINHDRIVFREALAERLWPEKTARAITLCPQYIPVAFRQNSEIL